MQWLETRRGLLEGVVFSGGEPLLQRQLPDAASAVREQGFAVALHTSGVYPDRLHDMLPLVDWVGLDIKAPFDEYALITGGGDGSRTRDALRSIVQAGTPHELRCTLDPDFFDAARARKMAMQLAQAGASHLVLQACRDETTRRSRHVPDDGCHSCASSFGDVPILTICVRSYRMSSVRISESPAFPLPYGFLMMADE